jgi:hypothetical protein
VKTCLARRSERTKSILSAAIRPRRIHPSGRFGRGLATDSITFPEKIFFGNTVPSPRVPTTSFAWTSVPTGVLPAVTLCRMIIGNSGTPEGTGPAGFCPGLLQSKIRRRARPESQFAQAEHEIKRGPSVRKHQVVKDPGRGKRRTLPALRQRNAQKKNGTARTSNRRTRRLWNMKVCSLTAFQV